MWEPLPEWLLRPASPEVDHRGLFVEAEQCEFSVGIWLPRDLSQQRRRKRICILPTEYEARGTFPTGRYKSGNGTPVNNTFRTARSVFVFFLYYFHYRRVPVEIIYRDNSPVFSTAKPHLTDTSVSRSSVQSIRGKGKHFYDQISIVFVVIYRFFNRNTEYSIVFQPSRITKCLYILE